MTSHVVVGVVRHKDRSGKNREPQFIELVQRELGGAGWYELNVYVRDSLQKSRGAQDSMLKYGKDQESKSYIQAIPI